MYRSGSTARGTAPAIVERVPGIRFVLWRVTISLSSVVARSTARGHRSHLTSHWSKAYRRVQPSYPLRQAISPFQAHDCARRVQPGPTREALSPKREITVTTAGSKNL